MVKRNFAFRPKGWDDNPELDALLNQWRRHCIGEHRLHITGANCPHTIDSCKACEDFLDNWESVIEYTTGI